MASKRNVLRDHAAMTQAIQLIESGLRAPLVAEMTGVSEWYIRKLVTDVSGQAPTRGQVPHSDLWFLRGRHQHHAVLFLAGYAPIKRVAAPDLPVSELFVRAMGRYRFWTEKIGWPELLTPDRAWWLIKMLMSSQLSACLCPVCGGFYLVNTKDRRLPDHGTHCWGRATVRLARRSGKSLSLV